MDRQTLNRYGCIIIVISTMFVMLALATPLGSYIRDAYTGIADGFEASRIEVMGDDHVQQLQDKWETILSKPPKVSIRIDKYYPNGFTYVIDGEDFDGVNVYKNETIIDTLTTSNGEVMSGSNIYIFVEGEFNAGDKVKVEAFGENGTLNSDSGSYFYVVAYALILDNSTSGTDPVPLVFVRSETPINVGDMYRSTTYGDRKVLASYTGYETALYPHTNGSNTTAPWSSYISQITSVRAEQVVKPVSMKGWFSGAVNASYFDMRNFELGQTTDISFTFYKAGYNAPVLSIIGLDTWNTSNVTQMVGTFCGAGYTATEWTILGIDKWNTSKVQSFEGMFASTGYVSKDYHLNVSGWDLSSCTMLDSMFAHAGRKVKNSFLITGLETWDVSKVQDMDSMFYYAGNTVKYNIDISMWTPTSVKTKKNFTAYAGGTFLLPNALK